jgi:hypothetical protein
MNVSLVFPLAGFVGKNFNHFRRVNAAGVSTITGE